MLFAAVHESVTGTQSSRCGTVCCHRGLLFMAIVEDAFPSRSDGRKQPLRPYRGSYAASEADHEYRHLISHRVSALCMVTVPAALVQNNVGSNINSESRAFWPLPPAPTDALSSPLAPYHLCASKRLMHRTKQRVNCSMYLVGASEQRRACDRQRFRGH